MVVAVVDVRSLTLIALTVCGLLCAACSGGDGDGGPVTLGKTPDAGMRSDSAMSMEGTSRACDLVKIDGAFAVEYEKDFTGRFRVGEPYTKTVMLFGGEPVETENVFSNAYVFGLDKVVAQMLAVEYPDFYLCNSPGGEMASANIISYDLVPANCDVYDAIVTALKVYHAHNRVGGDRTSIRFEGAPLELLSAVDDASGDDVTDQVTNMVPKPNFHLVTSVEQLTGESVLKFGTSN
jgi:hypothetical protein